MAKLLFQGSYTPDGVKGVLKEGGTGRRKAVEQTIKSAGGKLEAFYWAFGEDDFYIIADLPDNTTAAAVSLTAAAAGGVDTKTVVLLTAEEIDEAAKKSVTHRPPGG